MKEMSEEFKKVKEFQIISSIKGFIKSFKRREHTSHQYEVLIERDKGAYEVEALITVPFNYPQQAPHFQLRMLKWAPTARSQAQLTIPSYVTSKIDPCDLKNVNNLGHMQANRQPADVIGQEPTSQFLEQMEEELNVYADEFCLATQRDFLLSFQVRKLLGMLDYIYRDESGDGEKLGGLNHTDVKGRLRQRPCRFNSVQNKLEQ